MILFDKDTLAHHYNVEQNQGSPGKGTFSPKGTDEREGTY
jgi:hypothetical protein